MPYAISESRDKIFQFLKSHPVAALATVSADGAPHVATIYTSIDDDLNIYFITKQATTKSKNIAENNRVALAITDAHSLQTVQVQGVAEIVSDQNIAHQVLSRVTNVVQSTTDSQEAPVSKLAAGDYIVYRVSSNSIRFGEFYKSNINDTSDLFDEIQSS